MFNSVDNFKVFAEGLARDPNCAARIELDNGITMVIPSALLPGMIREVNGLPVERSITAGPVTINLAGCRVKKFGYTAIAPPEQAN